MKNMPESEETYYSQLDKKSRNISLLNVYVFSLVLIVHFVFSLQRTIADYFQKLSEEEGIKILD